MFLTVEDHLLFADRVLQTHLLTCQFLVWEANTGGCQVNVAVFTDLALIYESCRISWKQ